MFFFFCCLKVLFLPYFFIGGLGPFYDIFSFCFLIRTGPSFWLGFLSGFSISAFFRFRLSSFLGFGFIFTPTIFLSTSWRFLHICTMGCFLPAPGLRWLAFVRTFTLASHYFPSPGKRECNLGFYHFFYILYLGKFLFSSPALPICQKGWRGKAESIYIFFSITFLLSVRFTG